MIIEVYVLAASKIVLKNAAYRMTRVAIAEQDPKQVNLLRIKKIKKSTREIQAK